VVAQQEATNEEIIMKKQKYNREFMNAVDWVKVHGYDFHNQFSEEAWKNAQRFCELRSEGYKVRQAMAIINK
jgi:GH18 family chitinase